MQKIATKPAQKQGGTKEKVRDATMVIKKSKAQSMHGLGVHGSMSESERESMSKYSIKSIQPLDSARGAGDQDEQASSFDDSPSCPRVYEEIIQQTAHRLSDRRLSRKTGDKRGWANSGRRAASPAD